MNTTAAEKLAVQSNGRTDLAGRHIRSITYSIIPSAPCANCVLLSQSLPAILPKQDPCTDEWWGVERAAEYLGLKPKTVRENAASGVLSGRKFPPNSSRGKWRFKKEALDRCLNRGQSQAKKQASEPSIW